MIYGYLIVALSILVLCLDYAGIYIEKKRKITFIVELGLFMFIISSCYKHLFSGLPLYEDGGLRVDVAMLIFLTRETILSRIARSETKNQITELVRAQALYNQRELKTKKL